MHLETIQHLRQVTATHDDTVPVSKALLLDLLDSYEKSALKGERCHHPDTPICNAAQFDCQPGNPMCPNGSWVVPLETARELELKLGFTNATLKATMEARSMVIYEGEVMTAKHAQALVKLRHAQDWCVSALAVIDPSCGFNESIESLRGITLGFPSREAAAPGWISVKETMPETLVPVIVYGILEGEYEHDRHEAFCRHIGARDPWRSPRMENDENLRFREVTHWMPMPLAPVSPAVTPVTEVTPVNEVPAVNPVPVPETFDAHGHTWTRHTPGDPYPETNDRMLAILQRRGPAAGWAPAWHWKWESIPNFTQFEIMGWRYATPPAASPAAQPHPPALGDDTPRSSAPESAPPAP